MRLQNEGREHLDRLSRGPEATLRPKKRDSPYLTAGRAGIEREFDSDNRQTFFFGRSFQLLIMP